MGTTTMAANQKTAIIRPKCLNDFMVCFLLRHPARRPVSLHTPPYQYGIYSNQEPGQILSADCEILNRPVYIIVAAVSWPHMVSNRQDSGNNGCPVFRRKKKVV
jgi:hypothetical protein